MAFRLPQMLLLAVLFLSGFAAPDYDTPPSPDSCTYSEVLDRDVAIIGGGATGTYAAIRLREDLGKSVVVIEQKAQLGGHAETYTDPATGIHDNLGVAYFHDLPLVRAYFGRLGVPLARTGAPRPGVATIYADFCSGRRVPAGRGYTAAATAAALAAYAAQLARYPYLEDGFALPHPVPADLLLPFGAFATKHNVTAAVGFIGAFAQGLGDIARLPTLYVFKNFGAGVLRALRDGFLLPATHNTADLYAAAAAVLGADALLRAAPLRIDRGRGGAVRVRVRAAGGRCVLVRARTLVVTVPPTVPTLLAALDAAPAERALFAQFRAAGYYAGVLRLAGAPAAANDVAVANVGGGGAPFALPPLPALYDVVPSGYPHAPGVPGLFDVKFGAPAPLPPAAVRAEILREVRGLQAAGTIPPGDAELVAFASHAPFELTVPAGAIARGFYRDLYALQGARNTFYAGAAWHTHDSSLLWQFVETLLPMVAASTEMAAGLGSAMGAGNASSMHVE